ncbi:MAG TPA: hypothetical protein VHE59_02360 [Mucilaginibacter sp.]|nr:hypothetical protein [Mucilaginibacter sp.]
MGKEIEIIDAYNQLLYQKYDENGLVCLSDNEYKYKGENVLGMNNPAVVMASSVGVLTRLDQVCKKLNNKHFQKNPNLFQNELIVATGDIKYRIGTLLLYQPYIVSLIDSYSFHRGKKYYTYSQTRNDARFNRELPIAFECLYKFWQRVGDYLIIFFPDILFEKKGTTYFHDPFQYISKNHKELECSENYRWLKDFSSTIYPTFNKHRKFFVHHTGYDNQFFTKFLNANQDNSDAIVELDLERKNWTPFLKEQLQHCNDGYLKLMHFLNELEITKQEKGEFTYEIKK